VHHDVTSSWFHRPLRVRRQQGPRVPWCCWAPWGEQTARPFGRKKGSADGDCTFGFITDKPFGIEHVLGEEA
jgi:hypothetical protein